MHNLRHCYESYNVHHFITVKHNVASRYQGWPFNKQTFVKSFYECFIWHLIWPNKYKATNTCQVCSLYNWWPWTLTYRTKFWIASGQTGVADFSSHAHSDLCCEGSRCRVRSCVPGADLDSSDDVTRISIVLLIYSGGYENWVYAWHSEFEIRQCYERRLP
jgi:hypothetical protein